ncbi:MAG TPA: glycosyl hydrolase family 18 protein [Solirubrobacteraceae bacterium]|jgi:spore germination protein YaaH|nr:glycosyl hydrolase family 18 protein [Solirubrobacteraceae bacterium]
MAFAALLALLVCLAPAATSANTSRPRVRTLQAYVLASAPDSLRDLRAHAGSIGVVYPTYFDCAVPGGAVTGADVAAVTAYARSQRMIVMPRFNCQDRATVHLLLTEPAVRAVTLARLVAIARSASYQGLSLDLENDGASDRQALTSFVATLAASLHAMHKKLSVVVDGVSEDNASRSTGFYDDRALAALADTVFVLAWGAHWQGSAPGAIAPLAAASATATYLASLPNASRFVLGAPMYGLDWPAGGGPAHMATAYQYANVVALAHAVHANVARDPASGELTFDYTDAEGIAHQVWYMDATSVIALLRIARAHGLQTGLWRLGEEDQALWSSSLSAPT